MIKARDLYGKQNECVGAVRECGLSRPTVYKYMNMLE